MWTQTQTIATRPQASAAPVAEEVSSLLLTHDAEGMKDRVLKATFLCGVTGAAMTTLLKTAKRVPIFGEVFSLLADIKEYVEVFVETEEESKRMSVWCVSLMAVLGRLAQETQGDRDSEKMLKNAAGALRSVKVLVERRAKSMSSGVLAKAVAFWTASEYKKHMQVASEWLQKAIQALSLSVSAQTKADVVKVLDKVELLPRMDAKLDAMNDKMDKVLRLQESQLRLQEKQSASEKIKKRRDLSMATCEIDEQEVKQGRFIAEGGHGQVFKATYAGQPAAVKVIIVTGTLLQREKKARDFKREIELASRLRHPNINQIYGVITTVSNCLKVVMEYAPGGSLRSELDEKPDTPLPEDIQLKWSKEVCQGMKYLHGMKIAHRDLKSLNVLVKDGKLQIADFDMSRETNIGATTAASGATTVVGNIKYGTPSWSAPETFQSKKGDPFRADMYALGVVLWELATKKFPFRGMSRDAICLSVGGHNQRPGKPEDSSIPEVQRAIAACWRKNPDERKSAPELLDILNGKEEAGLAGFSFASLF